jgi:hypothetical protein
MTKRDPVKIEKFINESFRMELWRRGWYWTWFKEKLKSWKYEIHLSKRGN